MVLPVYGGPIEVAPAQEITSAWANNLSAGVEQSLAAVPTVNRKTGSFTIAAADHGTIMECDSAAPMTVTLPTLASAPSLPPAFLGEIDQVGAGQVTVVGASGVTLRTAASPGGAKTRARWSGAGLRRRATTATALSLTGLLARYKADSIVGGDLAVVSAWPESSGLGLPDAVQATATNQPKLRTGANGLGGHNVVQFDGTNDFLSLSGTALALAQNKTAVEVFVAFALPAVAITTGPRTMFSLSNGLAANASRLAVQSHSAAGSLKPQIGGRRLDADGFVGMEGPTALATGANGILTGSFQWTAGDLMSYLDGTLLNSNLTWQTAGSTSNTASLAGAIGSNANGTAEWFSGSIAEILIYTGQDLTGTIRANVHNYLYSTYALNNTPSDFQGTPDEWLLTGDTSA